ncbi:1,4-alpha-glucan branching protein GlgB, partial [Streptomyces longwoodensis]|uniref:1,4-alpha-glucan branching protein GlgB n=1 Tax=Streptomyces longwoodensis TaxID=68231 RepID=UPI003F4C470E
MAKAVQPAKTAKPSKTAGSAVPVEPAEQAVAKKAVAKKAAAKKTAAVAKKTTAAKAAAPAAGKTAAKTTTTAAKRTAVKAAAGETATVKKAAAKEAVAKKAAVKKAPAKKATTAKKAPAGTTDPVAETAAPAKEAAAKGTAAVKETAARTTAAVKETAARKAAAVKEAATRKAPAAQEPVAEETAAGPAVVKKAPAKKAPATKATTAKKAAAAKKVTPAKKTTATKATPVKKTTATKATPVKKTTTGKATTARKTTAAAAAAAAPPVAPEPTTSAAEPTPTVTAEPVSAPTAAEPTPAVTAEPVPAVVDESAPAPAVATDPTPVEATAPPALTAYDRDRLLTGTHHDPHGLLGAHPVEDGVVFRAFRPYARAVAVLAGEVRADLHDEGDGFFSGVLPLREVPAYRLVVTYEDTVQEVEDAYRFLPTLGELDLHLIGEGRHEDLWTVLGAHPMTHEGVRGTRFSVWAPNARGVRVAGTFNFWDGTGHPMRSLGSSGVWELFVPGIGEGELYKFDIARPDGSHTLRADPLARRTEVPPATSSIVTSSQYEWDDAEWLARRAERPAHQAPLSIYEVHLPSWRPGLTYRQLAEQLPAYVKELGFTHVELMPVAEHPFGGSWGYQVTGFYAPTARLGTPDDFRYLVDRLHQAGIGVLMDWVPAHFPRDAWALAEFDGRPLYEHEDPLRAAHPDWGTLEFDFGRREVRNFLVANAVYWCQEFHIDGLRVDAVASMLYLDYSREPGQWTPNEHGGRENLDAVAFLQEMNATVYRRCPGVVTVAEESTAWDGVTRATHHRGPSGFGGLGFGLKWNMGWMHDSLQYMSHEPVHRKYHHHEMTFSMVYAYSENYVLPISHDEVVHGKGSLVSKMPGDWWQQRANHRAYLGFMWSHPGKQLL